MQRSAQPRANFELMLCCAICSAAGADIRRIVERSAESVQWLKLIEAARKHRLDVALYRALQSHCAGLVPSSALDLLHHSYTENAAMCHSLALELKPLIDVFQREQILAIPCKGPAFAVQVYEDVTLRRCGDLDVLVRQSDMARCTNLMLNEGYVSQMHFTGGCSFRRGPLENLYLHWSPMERHQCPLSAQRVWDRRSSAVLLGATVPVMRLEDALLTLCFDGMNERWTRLDRVQDIAAVMRKQNEVNWRQFLALCRLWGCERIALTGMDLARELFSATLPDGVDTRLRSYRKTGRRAAYVRQRVMTNQPWTTSAIEDWRYFTGMREGRRERLQYHRELAHSLFQPKEDETRWRRTVRRFVYTSLRLLLIAIRKGLAALGH